MRTHAIGVALALVTASATFASAAADDDEPRGVLRPPGAAAIDATYAKECGACHLAYPPAFLPPASWRRVMGGLDRHFGQNAELDEPTRARLERLLTARAGRDRGGVEEPLRITETSWFRHEHREAPPTRVSPPSRSMASCAACHPGAARWDFEEDRATIRKD